jgi:hypothetical protein
MKKGEETKKVHRCGHFFFRHCDGNMHQFLFNTDNGNPKAIVENEQWVINSSFSTVN